MSTSLAKAAYARRKARPDWQAYMKDYRQKRREAGMLRAFEYKGGARCTDCDITDVRVLQFDHVPERGPKLFNIPSRVHIGNWDLVAAELDKCDVVCANCHAIRTRSRGR